MEGLERFIDDESVLPLLDSEADESDDVEEGGDVFGWDWDEVAALEAAVAVELV